MQRGEEEDNREEKDDREKDKRQGEEKRWESRDISINRKKQRPREDYQKGDIGIWKT